MQYNNVTVVYASTSLIRTVTPIVALTDVSKNTDEDTGNAESRCSLHLCSIRLSSALSLSIVPAVD